MLKLTLLLQPVLNLPFLWIPTRGRRASHKRFHVSPRFVASNIFRQDEQAVPNLWPAAIGWGKQMRTKHCRNIRRLVAQLSQTQDDRLPRGALPWASEVAY